MYNSLNDANLPELQPGNTEIWYQTKESWEEGHGLGKISIDPNDLSKTHILLGKIKETSLEKIFQVMQGDIWSPLGEARGLIRSKGMVHTSMSVGDVVVVNGQVMMVDRVGFKEIKEIANA